MAGDIRIEPMSEEHIEGFHRVLDTVARERKYLSPSPGALAGGDAQVRVGLDCRG